MKETSGTKYPISILDGNGYQQSQNKQSTARCLVTAHHKTTSPMTVHLLTTYGHARISACPIGKSNRIRRCDRFGQEKFHGLTPEERAIRHIMPQVFD